MATHAKDRIWRYDGEVIATYSHESSTFKTWKPRFIESRGKAWITLGKDVFDSLRRRRCRDLVFYEGTGEDRIKHTVKFGTFVARHEFIDKDRTLFVAMERMYLHTVKDPARKPEAKPEPVSLQPVLL